MSNQNETPSSCWYQMSVDEVLNSLESQREGLNQQEAQKRLEFHGPNQLPSSRAPGIARVFVRQFFNPLIYVLVIVGFISFLLGHITDAFFIFGVLIFNAVIGTFQEYNAEKSASALKKMASSRAFIRREGEDYEVDTANLVPGDIVLLESGDKVPADLRLLTSQGLLVDESMLTGESLPVKKDSTIIFHQDTPSSERKNMTFAGSLVSGGRAIGVVTETAMNTQLGKIAKEVILGEKTKTPLLLRMEGFSRWVAIGSAVVIAILGIILLLKGYELTEVLMLAVALGVAAIPEGLPIALTVTLSVATRRMSKHNVIVRQLAAVEALGSCTFVGTDKTGTLTVNELTVKKITLPGLSPITVEGSGITPEGSVNASHLNEMDKGNLNDLVLAGALCNDALLHKKQEIWSAHGDAVDVALLVMAHKLGHTKASIGLEYEKVDELPYASEKQFAAAAHFNKDGHKVLSIKGALEKILPMCSHMMTSEGRVDLDRDMIEQQSLDMAENGERVLGLAIDKNSRQTNLEQLEGLTFLGLVGMIDPLRPEAKEAIMASKRAGVDVAMITGDHPVTALSIARELELAQDEKSVVTGSDLMKIRDDEALDALVKKAKVFARVSPSQKLAIVKSLIRLNHFVAVTGDGANDAPAIKAAHVGVAMGKNGTDVAKETSDLIITDDKFSSIISGIEQGRIAYSNIRRVIYLVVSTGAAEIVLFTLSILAGLPVPLTAVQLLWLNMVTNGIQDVALAFEPGDKDELLQPPRSPREPIFNRIMIERVVASAIVMGGVSFLVFRDMIKSGQDLVIAQNSTLLLMVLFENIMIGNARSERRSAFTINPFNNMLLLFGTLFAQGVHIGAMQMPFFNEVLGMRPISFNEWGKLLLLSLSVIAAVEIHKLLRRSR